MANVNIKFNNKDYLLSCDDGQEEDLTIEVEAGQWYWQFGTPVCSEKGNENSWCVDGLYQQPLSFDKCKSNIDCLELPHGAVVHFRLTSKDVLHSFNFPEITDMTNYFFIFFSNHTPIIVIFVYWIFL